MQISVLFYNTRQSFGFLTELFNDHGWRILTSFSFVPAHLVFRSADLDALCSRFVGRYEQKFLGRNDVKGSRQIADRWLRAELYGPLCEAIRSDFIEHCRHRIDRYSAQLRGQSGQDTYFHMALTCIFAHSMNAIPHHNRRRNACYMFHAYRHYVSPDELEKFVRRTTLADIESRARDPSVEPDLVEQVLEGMEFEDRTEIGGPYPSAIEEAFERREEAQRRIEATYRAAAVTPEPDDEDWLEENESFDQETKPLDEDWDDDG